MIEIKFRVWNKKTKIIRYIPSIYCRMGIYGGLKVMLYTGLNDSNVKDIYEGDILSWERHTKTTSFAPRVIGNIYENPELLE